MKLAIVGSRDYPRLSEVYEYVSSLSNDTIIVSGGARGVDTYTENAAKRFMINPPVIFRPEISRKMTYFQVCAALFARNQQIVDFCDKLTAFWSPFWFDEHHPRGGRGGTVDVMKRAQIAGKLHAVILPSARRRR